MASQLGMSVCSEACLQRRIRPQCGDVLARGVAAELCGTGIDRGQTRSDPGDGQQAVAAAFPGTRNDGLHDPPAKSTRPNWPRRNSGTDTRKSSIPGTGQARKIFVNRCGELREHGRKGHGVPAQRSTCAGHVRAMPSPCPHGRYRRTQIMADELSFSRSMAYGKTGVVPA